MPKSNLSGVMPLKHTALGVLALATKAEENEMTVRRLQRALAHVVEKHQALLSLIAFRIDAVNPYSGRLEDALNELLSGGVEIDVHGCLLMDQGAADRQLEWLRERYGDEYFASLTALFRDFKVGLDIPDALAR